MTHKNKFEKQIDISDVSSGIYLIRFGNNNFQHVLYKFFFLPFYLILKLYFF